jgi:hypothetical protein
MVQFYTEPESPRDRQFPANPFRNLTGNPSTAGLYFIKLDLGITNCSCGVLLLGILALVATARCHRIAQVKRSKRKMRKGCWDQEMDENKFNVEALLIT